MQNRTLEQILNEDLQEVVEIGEDGGMVIDGRLPFKEAYKRMKQFWVDCNGQEDADDFFSNWCTEDSVGIAWLHLTTDEQKRMYEDAEWLVSTTKQSDYPVWFYQG